MASNNSKGRKAQRRAGALSRFSIANEKYSDSKLQEKYVERKEKERKSLKKV
jgi:hypothetical protein